MPVLRSWARTDVGKKRKHNEDAFLADDALGLYVVADGMGGHAAGEVASALAIRSIHAAVAESKPLIESAAGANAPEGRDALAQLLERAILKACADVHALSVRDPDKRGMGTTVVALLAAGKAAAIGHVGDSRAYVVRNGRAHQLTEDHTLVQEQLKRGLVTREQAAALEHRNVITRAVGIQRSVAVDTLVTDLLPGDLFVLCSDGLHGYLADDELAALAAGEREGVVGRLLDLALARGGKDNITAVALAIAAEAHEATADTEARTEALRRISLFQHMTYKELLTLLAVARGRQFAAGEPIVREGEMGEELFVLVRGAVEVSKGGLRIAQLRAGGHFGEMSLVDRAPRSATVMTAEETSAIAIDRESLLRLMRKDPLLAVKLLWSFVQVLSERLRNTNAALAEVKQELDRSQGEGAGERGGSAPTR